MFIRRMAWAFALMLAAVRVSDLPSSELMERPLAKPADWKPVVAVVPCPFWASPGHPYDYYAHCFDRPIMTGRPASPYVWQFQQIRSTLGEAVVAADIFADVNKPPQPGFFKAYLDAARAVPGIRVMPLLDVVLPQNKPQQEREDAAVALMDHLLKEFASDPGWFTVDGAPCIVDYGCGGLGGADGVGRVVARLSRSGHRFYWMGHVFSGLEWALHGTVDDVALASMGRSLSGIFQFGPPVDHADGGFVALRAAIDRLPSPRLLGLGVAPGYYSARSGMRNLVAQGGTDRLRRDLELAVQVKPDILSFQTWNDYVEAAHCEPSYKHTTAMLEIFRHYADRLRGSQAVSDDRIHLIASYRKNIYAGMPIEVELLNIPVGAGSGRIDLEVIVSDRFGAELARLPTVLNASCIGSATVAWVAPSNRSDMLRVEVSAAWEGRREIYRNLPPVPVVTDGRLLDPLWFSVPLHRLFSASQINLSVDGGNGDVASSLPRRLMVKGHELPVVSGVSYLRSGHVINDPTPETVAPVVDYFPDDQIRGDPLPVEYYGALVHFDDGRIGYSSGAWCPVLGQDRVQADYVFRALKPYQPAYGKDSKGKLWDRSGRGFHGTPHPASEEGLRWEEIVPGHDALVFDGQTWIDLPGARSFPIGPATVELIIRPEAVGSSQTILAQGGELLNVLIDEAGRPVVRHCNEDRTLVDAVAKHSLRPGLWYSLVATYDLQCIRLYINGRLEVETPANGLRPNEGARLGSPFWGPADPRRGGWGPYRGRIARFRVLQGVSTPDEIAAEAARHAGIYGW